MSFDTNNCNKHFGKWIMLCSQLFTVSVMHVYAAEESTPSNSKPAPAPQVQNSGPRIERGFYEVYDDLLSDFEYDIKNGQVTGLRDVSIRNIAVSENIPASFKTHLDLTLTEKILKNSKTKVIQCLPCRSKKTTLNGDQIVITSPETNPVELSRIAKIGGISHFIDAAFTYQSAGMLLSMTITEPDTGNIIWSRTYNSETSRASAFRRGVDFSQSDEARKAHEYQPVVQYRFTGYYLFEPDTTGTVGCLGIGFRMMERYDNRNKEVGFEIDYLKDATSIAGGTTTATKGIWSSFNLTMLFVHSWNFIGVEENYNKVRGGFFGGIGGTYASGFLGGLIRGGYEWRLAKHWAVQTSLGFRPSASSFTGSTAGTSVSGVEFGLGVSGLF